MDRYATEGEVMRVSPRSIQTVKFYISPVEFYRTELPVMSLPRGGGWRDGGLCPFHDDKHSGSFRVNLESGAFVCFSCGSKGGDIIAFIQQRDGLSFLEALNKLFNEWGL